MTWDVPGLSDQMKFLGEGEKEGGGGAGERRRERERRDKKRNKRKTKPVEAKEETGNARSLENKTGRKAAHASSVYVPLLASNLVRLRMRHQRRRLYQLRTSLLGAREQMTQPGQNRPANLSGLCLCKGEAKNWTRPV